MLAGVTGRFLAKGVDPFTAVCAAVSTHLAAGVIAAEQIGVDGVIASDVIAALPRARERSGAAPRRGCAEMALRAVAEVNLAAIERNAARLRHRVGSARTALRRGQGRRLRAWCDPVGAGRAARRRDRLLAVATAGEAGELRQAGFDVPILVLGAISEEELPVAIAAGAELTVWDPAFIARLRTAAADAAAADPGARQARHRARPARHPRARRGARHRPRGDRRPVHGCSSPA